MKDTPKVPIACHHVRAKSGFWKRNINNYITNLSPISTPPREGRTQSLGTLWQLDRYIIECITIVKEPFPCTFFLPKQSLYCSTTHATTVPHTQPQALRL